MYSQSTTPYQDLRKAAAAPSSRGLPVSSKGTPPEQSRMVVLAFAFIAFFSFCMTISGTATKVFTKDTQLMNVKTTLWSSTVCMANQKCFDVSLPDAAACTEVKDRQRAMQAFAVLSILSSVLAMVFSAFDVLGRSFSPVLSPLSCLVTTILVTLEFSLMGGTYHSRLCDSRSMSSIGYKLSGSFALFTCLWFVLVMICGYWVYKRVSGLLSQSAVVAGGDE